MSYNKRSRVIHEQITLKAYELYEKRGGEHGHHMEDWCEAEQQVLLGTRGIRNTKTKSSRPKSHKKQKVRQSQKG